MNTKVPMHEQLKHQIEKLIPLTDEEFAFIRSHFVVKNFKKGEFLIQQGEDVVYIYYVVAGLLKLLYSDESAKEHIASFAMEDWWESDFQAYYTQTKATMSLQCIEDTDVLCISIEDYKKLCEGFQKIETLPKKVCKRLSNCVKGFIFCTALRRC